jgi:hypothetical protein
MAAVLLAALALALPAGAQEQRASIEGVVKDAQGGAIVGAAVVARMASAQEQRGERVYGPGIEVVTDATGTYRFPALTPGRYEITATLSGFAPSKVQNIDLRLGQQLNINLTLQPGGVAETVQVVAESPLIAITQSARATNLRDEDITKMPKGRDFTSLVTQAPGANYETKLGGYSIDGASAAENRFIIDGAETTDLRYGTSGKGLITDFVEEVQVKSSGYAAEYGGSTGGVVNVITKSGTNTFRGDVAIYYSGDALGYPCGAELAFCDGRESLRRVPTDSSKMEYITYDKDEISRWDPGFNLSGPIIKDKLWFFAGYQPRLESTDRTWTSLSTGQTQTDSQTIKQHFATASVTGQLSQKTRFRVAYNNAYYRREGLLPTLDGTTNPLANLDVVRITPDTALSVNVDFTPSNRWFLSVRGGYYSYDDKDEGVYQNDRYLFSNSNVGMAGVPPEFQAPSGTQNQTTIFENTRDKYTRYQAQFDTTYFFSAGGEHQVKAGIQYDRRENDALYGETANLVTFIWNSTVGGQRGQYGYYTVRTNRSFPERGFLEVGKVATNAAQLFIQDSWTIGRTFTLNYGIRTENEVMPSYADPVYGFNAEAFKFDFGDKVAPRVGFAWDVKGDGRWKAYGSWGIFYDILKLDLARSSFGGAKWTQYYFSLDTPNWPSLVDVPGCPADPAACPGRQLLFRDFRYPSNEAIDPDIKPMKLQELVAGIEHELSPTLSVGARYVHKQVDRGIEDIGNLDAEGNEVYTIGNPGEALATNAYVFPDGTPVPFPKAQRDYDSVEFTLNRRMSNRWSARASYMWSRLYGNYPGLSQSDENGRVSPNIGRSFDYPIMMYDENGDPVLGVLPTDRTHQIKVQAIYDLPFGLSVGGNFFSASGLPTTREAAFIAGSGYPVMYEGRDSDGRTPWFNQLDIFAQYEMRLNDRLRLAFTANILNAFNTRTETNLYRTQLQPGNQIDVTDEEFFRGVDTDALIAEQGLQQDPRFLHAQGFQSPREIRLGARFSF